MLRPGLLQTLSQLLDLMILEAAGSTSIEHQSGGKAQ